jgi:DNA mismatch endonuclease Vsr
MTGGVRSVRLTGGVYHDVPGDAPMPVDMLPLPALPPYRFSVPISSLSGLNYDLEPFATENGALDTVSPGQRSRIMAAVKGKNTKPELRVRRFLHRRGLCYRLHVPDLPGTPDLVFRAKRAVVFVHGCVWHQCPHCRVASRGVKSNTGYWFAKLICAVQ